MSGAIQKLVLRNFKGFPKEETIEFNAKHVLLYGENGSGKSSIYWALYTLFQSATKKTAEVKKYFTPNDKENLLNLHEVRAHPSFEVNEAGEIIQPLTFGNNAYVEAHFADGSIERIDHNGLSGTKAPDATERDENLTENINRHSDFIAHRILINFYNYRNSKEINLWQVFVRDIFPFLLVDKGAGEITLGQRLKELENSKPYRVGEKEDKETGKKYDAFELTKKTTWQESYKEAIRELNRDINYWVGQINSFADDFYQEHFEPIYNDGFRISIEYKTQLYFAKHQSHEYKINGKKYERWFALSDWNEPNIALKLESKNEDGEYTTVQRPQSFLNEAKLTSIALAMRFSLLTESIRPELDGKFLALDDLLVSLDMANRDKVMDIILGEFSTNYKIYLFTHEKSFFNLAKLRIESEYDSTDWLFKEMFTANSDLENPTLRPTQDYITSAINQFKQKDYPASVNYLRKALEKVLSDKLPKKVTKDENGVNLKNLDNIITAGIGHLNKLNQPTLPLRRCQQYVKILLNPLSHNENDIDAYETDILGVTNIIEKLEQFLTELDNRRSEFLARGKKINLLITEIDGKTKQKYTLVLIEDLYQINDADGVKLSSCKLKSLESRTYFNGVLKEKESYKNEHWESESLQALYLAICKHKDITPQDEYLNFFETLTENSLVNMITE